MPIGRLHILTDFFFQQRHSHGALARLAIAGGADVIQFRQKHGHPRHRLHEAYGTAAVCASAGIPLLIDDDVDIALATGAAGVHVGQTDFPVSVARRLLGDAAIIGATATTRAQARQACEEGASYIGFGPVFPTGSKASPAAVKGLEGLAEVCQAVPIPVIAIAGMTPQRVRAVLATGAHGLAVMTAVTCADDPAEATTLFRREIDAFLHHDRSSVASG
jgi:thiamine-phosphate pyrophosphorylase